MSGALLAVVGAVAAARLACAEHEDCRANFHDKYFCEAASGTCKRLPLTRAPSAKNVAGLALVFAINALTASFGISGSGPLYACIISLLDFTTKDAIPLYKVSNLLGAALSTGLAVAQRQRDNPNALRVDWPLLAFSLPLLFAGSIIGVLLADTLPGLALHLAVAATLVHVLCRAREARRAARRPAADRGARYDAVPKLARVEGYAPPRPLVDLLFAQLPAVAVVLSSFELMSLAAYARGSTRLGLYLGVRACSPGAFALLAAGAAACAALAWPFAGRAAAPATLGAESFLAGVVTTIGISGSVFYSAALLAGGTEPATAVAASGVSLFLSSLGTIAQFGYLGYLDAGNGLLIAAVSLGGSLAGNALLGGAAPRLRARRLLPDVLFLVTLSTLAISFPLAWYEFKSNNNFTAFGSLC